MAGIVGTQRKGLCTEGCSEGLWLSLKEFSQLGTNWGRGRHLRVNCPGIFCSSASVSRGLNPSSNFMWEEETHCIWKYTFQSLLFLVKENFASSAQGKIKSHSQVCHWNDTNFVIFSSIIYNICISCFGNVLRIPSNIGPGEAEVGRSLSLRPAWAIQ